MSAFVVSKTHIAALIQYFAGARESQWESDRWAPDWEETKACLLLAENVRSVNHRYPNHEPEAPETFTYQEIRSAPALTPVQVIKACHCLDYQSCETEDWKQTPAYRLLRRIEASAISALDGYEEAPWDIDNAETLNRGGSNA